MAEWITYRDGPDALTGFLAPSPVGPGAPAVLIFTAWLGISESIRDRAKRLAAQGYTAFAADMFGKPTAIEKGPRAMVDPFMNDRTGMRRRARAGLAALRARPECDPRPHRRHWFTASGAAWPWNWHVIAHTCRVW